MITLRGVSKRVPGRVILDDVNLSFLHGAKIGVLGQNGAGKSTLLKAICGEDDGIEGEVWVKPGKSVGYMHQEPVLDPAKDALGNVLEAVRERYELVQRYEEIADEMGAEDADIDALIDEQASLQEQIDAHDCWEVVRDVRAAMRSLRCPPDGADVSKCSGGERRRIALCRLLLSEPDVLILVRAAWRAPPATRARSRPRAPALGAPAVRLSCARNPRLRPCFAPQDEPTNHLDASSVAWLEGFLSVYAGTVIAVTHDRYFLDNIAQWILEVERGAALPFHGNYSAWLRAKAEREEMHARMTAAQTKHMARELEWIQKSARGGQRKGRARIAAFERVRDDAAAAGISRKVESGEIVIVPGPRLGANVLEISGLRKARGERVLFDGLSLRMEPGDVLGVIGANGTGKSTLLSLIDGSEPPDAGAVRLGATVALAHVSQSRGGLTPTNSVYEEIAAGVDVIDAGEQRINTRAYVSSFNLRGPAQEKRVDMLSGGERGRVHLAKALKSGCNLLLLDEPTNDLDVDTLRSLEEALAAFEGSAIVVSHDRWFLDRVATHLLLLHGDGRTTYFSGTWDEYVAHLAHLAKAGSEVDGATDATLPLSEGVLEAARTAGRRGLI